MKGGDSISSVKGGERQRTEPQVTLGVSSSPELAEDPSLPPLVPRRTPCQVAKTLAQPGLALHPREGGCHSRMPGLGCRAPAPPPSGQLDPTGCKREHCTRSSRVSLSHSGVPEPRQRAGCCGTGWPSQLPPCCPGPPAPSGPPLCSTAVSREPRPATASVYGLDLPSCCKAGHPETKLHVSSWTPAFPGPPHHRDTVLPI